MLALQGLGILARRQQPQHVLAFLQTLDPVAGAAGAVARQVLVDMRSVAAEVQQRWDTRQQELEAAEAAALAAAGGDRAAATQAEIRAFFEQRGAAQRAQQQAGGLDDSMDQDGHPIEQMELGESCLLRDLHVGHPAPPIKSHTEAASRSCCTCCCLKL